MKVLRGIVFSILLVTTINVQAFDGEESFSIQTTTDTNKYISRFTGLNIKVLPTIFWGTLGVEVEYPIRDKKDKISVGTLLMVGFGRLDGKNANFIVRDQPFLRSGISVDIFGRYFLSKDKYAPLGLYVSGNISYNTLLYFDGDTRPFTLFNRRRRDNTGRELKDIERPNAFNAGVGVGYQLIMIPDNIIANIELRVQGRRDSDGTIFPTVSLLPTIGFKF